MITLLGFVSLFLVTLMSPLNVSAREEAHAYTPPSATQVRDVEDIETVVTRTDDGKVVVTQYWQNRGGLRAFFPALLFGPRIALERNEGREIRWFEYVRGVPYLGWTTVPYMCYEALSGFQMQEVANLTGVDQDRQADYYATIKELEEKGEQGLAEALREQDPFNPNNHPLNPEARMPRQGLGGRMKSAAAGILVDRRAGLERNEGRGIMTHEWFRYLIIPTLGEAVAAYRGETMTEVARDNHLDEAWLEYNREHGGALQPVAVSAR
jgi:hypothetical protein